MPDGPRGGVHGGPLIRGPFYLIAIPIVARYLTAST